jgi:hypothetical protein
MPPPVSFFQEFSPDTLATRQRCAAFALAFAMLSPPHYAIDYV